MNIQNLFKFVCFLSRLNGLVPFSIKYNSRKCSAKVLVNKMDLFSLLIFPLILCAIAAYESIDRRTGATLISYFHLLIAINFTMNATIGFVRRESFLKIVQTFISIDRQLHSLGIHIDHIEQKEFVKNFHWALLVASIVPGLIKLAFGYWATSDWLAIDLINNGFYRIVIDIVINFAHTAMYRLYLFMLFSIYKRYKVLNEWLR